MKRSGFILASLILFSASFLFAQSGVTSAPDMTFSSGKLRGISTPNQRVEFLSPSCPTPVFDVTPSKVLNCNSACALLTVRDSAAQSPQGSVTPGWRFTINNIDNGFCFDAREEIWENGTIIAAVGNNSIGTTCTGGCSYLGAWSTFYGTCTIGSSYTVIQEHMSPTTTVEVRIYYPTSNSSFAWNMNNNFDNALVASGVFNYATVTTNYLTSGTYSKATGINQGTAVFTCPTCPPASWADGQNGFAQFCPALATPGKYGFTYSFTAGSCSKSFTDTITVNTIYNANWAPPAVICQSGTYNLNNYLSGSATPGGTWSGTGVPGSGIGWTPASAGAVSVTYTYAGATSCQVAETHTINVQAAPVVTIAPPGPVSFCAGTPVNLTLTASGASTYAWNTAATTSSITVNPVVATTYTVVGTSVQGCNTTATVSVTFTPVPTVSVTAQNNVNCKGQNTGDATITAGSGTPAYTYAWAPASAGTNASASGLTAGSYTVTVTDSKGCTVSNTVTITEPAVALTGSVSAQTSSNCGQSNGSATITASGGTSPYSYSWSPSGGTAASASNLAANNYVITITDSKLCTQTASVTITNANGPSVSVASQNNAACNGGAGSVSVSTTGGTGPYTYAWSPGGATTSAITGFAGTYTAIVTDATGCTTNTVVAITQPTAVTSTVTSTSAGCGMSDGTAAATPNGGTPGYTYNWSNGQTTSSATGLSAGTYTVTVKDANGCSKISTATVTGLPGPTAVANTSTTIVSGSSITLSASGGVSYSWNTSPVKTTTSISVSPLVTTVYCVTVKDVAGCTDSACVTIHVKDGCAEFSMPNAFSPNGDNHNELFRPNPSILKCFKDIDFIVYNRWGNVVFSTTDIKEGWNGTSVNGEACNEGVYFYTLKGTFIDGIVIDKKGTVTLMK